MWTRSTHSIIFFYGKMLNFIDGKRKLHHYYEWFGPILLGPPLSSTYLKEEEKKAKLAKQWTDLFPCLLTERSYILPPTRPTLLVSSTKLWKRERPPCTGFFHSLHICEQSYSYWAFGLQIYIAHSVVGWIKTEKNIYITRNNFIMIYS